MYKCIYGAYIKYHKYNVYIYIIIMIPYIKHHKVIKMSQKWKNIRASSASTPLRIQVGGTTCRASHLLVLSVPKPNCSSTPKVPGCGTHGTPRVIKGPKPCFRRKTAEKPWNIWGCCSGRSAKMNPPVLSCPTCPEIIEIAAPGPVSALPKCMWTPTFSTWTDPKSPP